LKLKECGRYQVKANKEAMRAWFSYLIIRMDLADHRRNHGRHLPHIADDLPEISEITDLNTHVVPFKPGNLIISNPTPYNSDEFFFATEFQIFS